MITVDQRDALELRDVAASEPWETIRRARPLISRKVGLIRQIAETCYQAQDPALFVTGLLLSDFSNGDHRMRLTASGAGDSAAAALAAAIGEAVEHYCACSYDPESLVLGTARELASEAVAPDALRLFSREQADGFGSRGPSYFDERSRVRWVRGYSLTERRPRLVPASFVYLTYRAGADEDAIGHLASTGTAAGATREEAILSALLEVVERDAFTLSWLHRRPGRRIDVDDDDELATAQRERLRADRPGVDARFFDLTTDLNIPVVYGLVRRPSEHGPVPCQGLASRLSPRRAVRKCIHEAGQSLPVVRNLMTRQREWQPAADFSNVNDFEHHFLTYLKRPDFVEPAFAFYDACDDRVALSALDDRSTGRVLGDIEYAVAALARAGHETIVVDITTEDIASTGFSVVRAIVPGLVPLHHNHLRPYLGVHRLASGGGDRNPWPHPFP